MTTAPGRPTGRPLDSRSPLNARLPLNSRLTVVRSAEIAADIREITLARPDRGPLPAHPPGSHVVVECGPRRNAYSLTNSGTQPYAYTVAGREQPAEPLRVELTLPSGAIWTSGPDRATDRISGTAGDYCRVFVQRRRVADTNLVIEGPAALSAISVARAFL